MSDKKPGWFEIVHPMLLFAVRTSSIAQTRETLSLLPIGSLAVANALSDLTSIIYFIHFTAAFIAPAQFR
jgi:hypothetical protein